MSDSSNGTRISCGVSLFSLVFIVFLVLKLAAIGVVATWSWWWVTAPLWGPITVLLGIGAVLLVIWLIATTIIFCRQLHQERKRRKRATLGS